MPNTVRTCLVLLLSLKQWIVLDVFLKHAYDHLVCTTGQNLSLVPSWGSLRVQSMKTDNRMEHFRRFILSAV